MTIERILVATDLSARSERAIRRAHRLATRLGAHLTAITVIDEDLPTAMIGVLRDASVEQLEGLQSTLTGAPMEIRVAIGDPVTEVGGLAAEIDAGLLVLGIHRARPLRDALHGATMERLVRASQRGVLLAIGPADRDYERVLCGVDLSPASAAAARTAAEIAPDAAFHAFHAVHIPYRSLIAPGQTDASLGPLLAEAGRHIDEWWTTADLPAALQKPVPEAASVTHALETAVRDFDPDLLAIGAHGRPSLAPTLLGAFTTGVLREPPCDVLVERR